MNKTDLIAIVGPTGSGKTELAIKLATKYDGEIIAADSRTLYRGMDIGTAKPTPGERQGVPHHLIDVVSPGELYNTATFQHDAKQLIEDIHQRNHLPILVGGSGLYIWSVLYDYDFPAGPSAQRRAELDEFELETLAARLQEADPERAAEIDIKNKRRVVRALETIGQPRDSAKQLSPATVLIGINPGMAELEARLAARTDSQIRSGLIDEAKRLFDRYNSHLEVFNTVPYREVRAFLDEEVASEAELAKLITLRNRQLAKRQLTWLKRNSDIHWVSNVEEGLNLAAQQLKTSV